MKNFSTLKLEHLQLLIEALKVEQDIQDKPRKVTNYHFCRSQPKVRHSPQLFGLSKNALDLIALH
jgi:hypothetical protein